MREPHPVRCQCGSLLGEVHPVRPANRCICYCRDCRSFARHLGRASEILDESGGTEIIQVPPAHLRFTQGTGHLGCLRLTERGLLRWYATCCNTPIGNTMGHWNPAFVGLVHTCLGKAEPSLEASFGPITMHVNSRSAIGARRKDVGIFPGVAKVLSFAARARLDGSYRSTPFFSRPTGFPVVVPTVLTRDQLGAARRDT